MKLEIGPEIKKKFVITSSPLSEIVVTKYPFMRKEVFSRKCAHRSTWSWDARGTPVADRTTFIREGEMNTFF